MNLMKWPEAFTRGLPEEEGCYVCIVYDSDYQQYSLKIFDIDFYGALAAEEFGEKEGLFVDEHLEGNPVAVHNMGIVGYKKLDGVGVFSMWACDGFEKETKFLKLNEAGIDFYMKFYRRELERLRVKEWDDTDYPPSPPLMPPMPQFSRSFFTDEDD